MPFCAVRVRATHWLVTFAYCVLPVACGWFGLRVPAVLVARCRAVAAAPVCGCAAVPHGSAVSDLLRRFNTGLHERAQRCVLTALVGCGQNGSAPACATLRRFCLTSTCAATERFYSWITTTFPSSPSSGSTTPSRHTVPVRCGCSGFIPPMDSTVRFATPSPTPRFTRLLRTVTRRPYWQFQLGFCTLQLPRAPSLCTTFHFVTWLLLHCRSGCAAVPRWLCRSLRSSHYRPVPYLLHVDSRFTFTLTI